MRCWEVALLSFVGLASGCGEAPLTPARADVTVSPDTVRFGTAWVGDRVERTVALENRGRATAMLAVSGLDGPFAGPETVIVPAAGRVEVTLTFRPIAAGESAVKAVLSSSDQRPVEVTLLGEGVAPTITLGGALDFGPVRVGEARAMPLSVRNEAELPLTSPRAWLSGDDADSFAILRDVRQVAPGETAELEVAFAPVRKGTHRVVLSMAACGTCLEETVFLEGRGIDRDLRATPGNLDFGAVPPGGALVKSVAIANRGEAVAAVRSLRVEGEGFAATALGLPVDLGLDESIELAVTFAPTVLGDHAAALVLVDETGAAALEVPLVGRGGGPRLVAHPAAIDLGRVPVGWRGHVDLAISNDGEPWPVEVTARVEGGAGWSLDAPAAPAIVGEVGLTLGLDFVGTGPGDDAAELVLATSHPGQPELRVPLAARVVDDTGCRIDVNPSRLRFGLVSTGGTYFRDVELTNTGAEPCIVWDVGLDPAGAATFAMPAPMPLRDLAPGERMTVLVSYWPTEDSPAVETTAIRYRTSSLERPEGRIEVSGYAQGFWFVFFRPEYLAFGEVRVGRESRETLALIGNRVILGMELASGSDPAFGLLGNPVFPLTLNGDQPFVIDFVPRRVGPHRGELEIPVEGSPEPILLRLRGEGVDPPCEDDCEPPAAICPGPGTGVVTRETTLVGAGVESGGLAVCQWTVVSAPPGGPRTESLGSSCTTSFRPRLVGEYTLRLRVLDALGNVGECSTTYASLAPPEGLWVETVWTPAGVVRLQLLHDAAGDPLLRWTWSSRPYACEVPGCTNFPPDWDLPGPADDPGVVQETVLVGPQSFRIEAPSTSHGYHVGVLAGAREDGRSLQVTTNVYCGGNRVASEEVVGPDSFWLGTVAFTPSGACTWTHVGRPTR